MFSRRSFLQKCFVTTITMGMAGMLPFHRLGQAASTTDIPVLLYHRVGDGQGHMTVSPERFSADLLKLKSMGFTTITLDLFRRYMADPEIPLPENPLMISFDDGYRDNFLNAYPILRDFGMTAAFYIITGMVGEEDRLTSAHIREMAANGMSIGSHTVSHRELGKLNNEEASAEMSLSRLYLEGLLQQPVSFIAYPKGSYNEFTAKLANESAYNGGFSVEYGTCTQSSNPYALRRIPVFSFDREIKQTMLKRGWG
jgi:peptidoglycan/xylan/chitin deacetylase (PgdA/CDA1 family)